MRRESVLMIGVSVLACVGTTRGWAQAPVEVTNPADIAKAIGVQKPFVLTVVCTNGTGPNNVCDNSAAVPAGVRLVVENLSYACFVPNGASVTLVRVLSKVSGADSVVFPEVLPARFFETAPVPQAVTTVSTPAKLYADVGTKVTFFANLNATAPINQFTCVLTLHGQAITVP